MRGERRYDVAQAKQRCSNWLESHRIVNSDNEDIALDDTDPFSDPLHDTVTYSADEEVSNYSQPRKKRKRNREEDLSEVSEVSQDQPKHGRLKKIYDDAEGDTSLASDEISDVAFKKPLTLKAEVLKLKCGWKNCDYVTSETEDFVSHVSSHIPNLEIKCNEDDDEEVYTCLWERCEFETPNADEVTRHVNFHSYHTKVKYIGALICSSWKLPECTYDTAGVNLVPDLPEPLQCLWNECPLTSNNPNIFYTHVAMHSQEIPHYGRGDKNIKKFKCLWKGCKSEMPNRKRMQEHLRGHSKERLAACPTCGALYSSRMRLIDHIKRQAPEEYMTYQCTHCSRAYPSERILRDHMRHHVNHYKCQFCDMTCPTPHSLSNHIRHRHIDDKPFACEYCEYRAKTQYNVRRHMATHSGSLSFVCEEEDCNFSCRTLSVLNWHYRKNHESRAEYCCHMCDMRFARGAYLTRHLMKKHNFRWPSGHTRFRFYKNHEDGLFRLQTVRYESLDVVEDINRREGEPTSVLNPDCKFNISKVSGTTSEVAANFIVKVNNDNEDPDDPEAMRTETEEPRAALSMPSLDFESPTKHKKVFISIDEVDCDGNIISSKTLEADELSDIDEMENAHVVADGYLFDI